MKLSTTLGLTICTGVAAFGVGHLSQPGEIPGNSAASNHRTKSSTRVSRSRATRETAEAAVRVLGKYAACSQEFSAGSGVKLSTDERMQLLAYGAQVGDFGNQEAMLCGLVSVLTRDELSVASDILKEM